MEREVSCLKAHHDGTDEAVTIDVLEGQLNIAIDKLLLTNFQECFELCRHIVSAASKLLHTDAVDTDRVKKVLEAATVIGIQALAETGAWRKVIPFVEEIYTHVAASPPQIMHMCLLLHAHVREYYVCHSLVNAWLECNQHASLPDSKAIVSSYITSVLVPLGAFNMITQALDRCTIFSSEEKQQLLSPAAWSPSKAPQSVTSSLAKSRSLASQYIPASEHTPTSLFSTDPGTCMPEGEGSQRLSSERLSSQPALPSDDAQAQAVHSDGKDNRTHVIRKIVSLYVHLTKRLWRRMAKYGLCHKIRKISKILFLLSFVLLAVLHVQTDVTTNFSRAMELWTGACRSLGGILRWPSLRYFPVTS